MKKFRTAIAAACFSALLAMPAMAGPDMSLTIQPAKSAKLAPWAQRFSQDKELAKMITWCDELFNLPQEIPVVFAETGKVNAWYAPDRHAIIVSYELADHLEQTFLSDPKYHDQASKLAQQALHFILLHEMGHALMTEGNLPYTGKNEDCADEIAAILSSTWFEEQGREDAQAAAAWFLIEGNQKLDHQQIAFWDEHSFDLQRYYNVLADIEASAPGAIPEIEEILPAARLQRARERWPSKVAAWGFDLKKVCPILQTHYRQPEPKVGNGKISVVLEEAEDEQTKPMAQLMSQVSLQPLMDAFSKLYLLPQNLEVRLVDDTDPYCRYEPDQHRVVMSYGWVADVGRAIYKQGLRTDDDRFWNILGGAVTVELCVRVQQMALQEMKVPFTGEPEDAAAEALMLFFSNGVSADLLHNASLYHLIRAKQNPDLRSYAYWSEDDVHYQMFMDMDMYLYANDPVTYAWVEDMVPKSRLDRVKRELPVKKEHWERIMRPFVR